MKRLLIFLVIVTFVNNPVNSQELIKDFGNNHISTPSISFTSDGKYMIVGGYGKLYDMASGTVYLRTIKQDTETQGDYAFSVSMSGDNRTFLLSKMNMIEVWDLQSRTKFKTIRDLQLAERSACFSTDGKNIIYMRRNGEIVFVNSSTFLETLKQKITSEKPSVISPSPDGKKLFIGTRSNSIIIFDISTGQVSSIKIDGKDIYQIELPGSGNYIAASSADGRIWLGNYPSLERIGSWQAHTSGFTAISFHPSGRYLVSGGKDKLVRIWNIPDHTIKAEWEAHKMAVFSVAFSPDGTCIASGSLNDPFGKGNDTRIWSFAGATAAFSPAKEKGGIIPQPAVKTQPVQANTLSQKRLALLLGNSNYQNSALANPANDAREMKNILTQYGFDVIEYEDLTQSRMKMAMDEFGEKLKGYDVGLFFYAGHGIQSKGYNYLIPVDANLKTENQVEYDCVQADRILALMEASGTKVNIIILDACRNNPFERSWTRSSAGKGLAFMSAPSGSLIAYATAPGSTASDGSGKNGLYTSAILESIKIPQINILQIFQNVRKIVSEESGGQQIPWESTSLTGDFYF
jgi:WD40 repeat protein